MGFNSGFKGLNPAQCCILCGPGGERIVDIVPGGTELELQLRWGVGQAAHALAIIPTSSV